MIFSGGLIVVGSFTMLSVFTGLALLDLLFPTPHELRYSPVLPSKESFMNYFRFIFFATDYTDLHACLTASCRQGLYFCHELREFSLID